MNKKRIIKLSLLAVVLILVLIDCLSVRYVNKNKMISALETTFGIEASNDYEPNTYKVSEHGDKCHISTAFVSDEGSIHIDYEKFESSFDARLDFKDRYLRFDKSTSEDVDKDQAHKFGKLIGIRGGYFIYDSDMVFLGIYYVDDVVIQVHNLSLDGSKHEETKAFLKKLGLPVK